MKSTFYIFLAVSPDRYISIQDLRLSFLAATRLRSMNQKKPTWQNTLRNSTTSAYSLTSLPVMTGLPFI